MAGRRRSAGSNVSLTTQRKRKSGGAWVTLTTAKRRLSGAWVNLFESVVVNDATYSSLALSPDDSSITVSFTNTGLVQISQNSFPSVTQYTWLLSGAASDYQIRATLNSGTLTSGVTGSWLNFGQSWNVTRTTNVVGTSTATITIEIRDVATSTVQDSGVITLNAVVDS